MDSPSTANDHDSRTPQSVPSGGSTSDPTIPSSDVLEMFTYQLNQFEKLTEHGHVPSNPPLSIKIKRPAPRPLSPTPTSKQRRTA
ncbi:hypothetical protein CVT26_005478 [Gymnopilus dilepis]|uniref:Uncharacterized protein n=1 Tax=Gymnopilus dilepis TaxID=231916 RepID=A0A409YT96_9AGAR|nr:hypothetical protein CVT26_005478 [Gymnopilus dilepis]